MEISIINVFLSLFDFMQQAICERKITMSMNMTLLHACKHNDNIQEVNNRKLRDNIKEDFSMAVAS